MRSFMIAPGKAGAEKPILSAVEAIELKRTCLTPANLAQTARLRLTLHF